MNKETKLAIIFSSLVVIVSGAVFAYLASTNWPDVDSSYLNLHIIRANRNERLAKQAAEAQAIPAPIQTVDYSDETLGISFKHPVGWTATLATKSVDQALTLSDGAQVVDIVKYANPKMRATLAEYMTKKFNMELDVDYKNVVPMTVAGKEAYKITVNEEGSAVASYDQVWVKISDTAWLAIGNLEAPQVAVDAVVSSLMILQ